MRGFASVAGLVPGAAFACSLLMVPAHADAAKITCCCDYPDIDKAKARHSEKSGPRQVAGVHYSYRDAMAVHWRQWQGGLQAVPAQPKGLVIDQAGWSGGVGYGEDGGGGYGQVLLVNGDGPNGPTYNNLGESLQQNPSMAHPFQSRLMGGLAPHK